MAQFKVVSLPEVLFPYGKWNAQLSSLAGAYQANRPFPHIHLTEFLQPEVAREIAAEFPAPGTEAWTQYKHHNENKLGMAKRSLFPPGLGAGGADAARVPARVSRAEYPR